MKTWEEMNECERDAAVAAILGHRVLSFEWCDHCDGCWFICPGEERDDFCLRPILANEHLGPGNPPEEREYIDDVVRGAMDFFKRTGWNKHHCQVSPLYSTNASDDYLVLAKVREWGEDDKLRWTTYGQFWTHLAEILRARDPYYKPTVNQYELYYMLEYQPGDYSHAAFLAVNDGVAVG